MRKVELYIAGQKVDLDEKSFILFNYTREELSNPTIVRNSFSKEITIPGTPDNNKLFGHFFRLDRQTIFEGGAKGVEFDAMRKTDFVIFSDDGSILEQGYVRMNSITKNDNDVQYKVSLYGGLGSFFYSLTYNDDGIKRTLADLKYSLEGQLINPYTYYIEITAAEIKRAWDDLENVFGNYPIDSYHGIINYMPAYNGYPDKFDANKVYYKPYSKYTNCPNLYVAKDGYTTHPDADGGILIEMKNNHNEWEMQDLRSYLQRPVIRFSAILDAITHEEWGGYRFEIDKSCEAFNPDIVETGFLWMTLPLIDWEKYHDSFNHLTMSALLEDTLSPADYLISYAKMMGHVFVTDTANKKVTMMTRDELFRRQKEQVIDLSHRINIDSMEITPCSAESQYYVWETENYGEEAKKYEERYGQKFGCKIVNTGYEFNSVQEKVLQNYAFKGACDVMERNLNYKIYGGDADAEYGDYHNYFFKFAMTEEVSWKLYKSVNGELTDQTFTPSSAWLARFDYSKTKANDDMFPKVQLHGADNKPEDGSNVLVVYSQTIAPTAYVAGGFLIASVEFFLTDDTEAMLNINGGKPCWNYSRKDALLISKLPSFRRHIVSDSVNRASLDFGASKEVYVSDYDYEDVESQNNNIYVKRWRDYISDVYNANTRVLKCKVNLNGLQVNDDLLGRFYWFDNCVWALNKIINHSITTEDLTECEFIKVNDIKNYTEGQKL